VLEFFRSSTIEKKEIFTSEIKHTKHRSPCLYEPLTYGSVPACSSQVLELAISSGKNGSRARIVGPKVHHLTSVDGSAG